MPRPTERTGPRWPVLSCTSIPRASPPARAAPGKAIWHARSGWPNTAIGTFCAAAPLVDVRISGDTPAVVYPLALKSGPGGCRCRPSHDIRAAPLGLCAELWSANIQPDLRKIHQLPGFHVGAASHKSFTTTTPAESVKLQTDAFVATSIRHHVMPCVRLPHAAVAREAATRGRRTSFACSESWSDQRCHQPPIGGL